jgi:hypothetical protein
MNNKGGISILFLYIHGMMNQEDIYQAEQELARYNDIMFNKEVLTQEEYDFCKSWDANEAYKYLNNIGPDFRTGEIRYLNTNVYSEADKEEYDLMIEMGV